MQKTNGKRGILASTLAFNLASAGLFFAMDWLFFVTKASFMDSFHALGKAGALVIPGVAMGLVSTLVGAGLGLARPGPWIPAFWCSATALLLVDNFVYTLIRVGIVNSRIAGRILFLALFVWLYRKSFAFLARLSRIPMPAGLSASLVLLPLGLALGLALAEWSTAPTPTGLPTAASGAANRRRPNILFLSLIHI